MNATARPLVSVVVTFYNQAEFVPSALDSILGQTYQPVEIIAVDDGSTDDTLRALAAYDSRITVIRQDNAGPSDARNAGLRQARGALVTFLDGDDIWMPEKLQVQVEAARSHPSSGLVAVDGLAFSSAGITRETLYQPSLGRRLDASDGHVFTGHCFDMMLDGKFSLIATPSQVMIPAAVFHKIGTWNPRFRVGADYELYLRIAAHWPLTFAKDKLVRYRINPAGLSGPEPMRAFSWVEEKPAIFRSIAGQDRRRAARLISELARETALQAYNLGNTGHRRLATRFLMGYALRSSRPHVVLPYLVALWCPPSPRARLVRAFRSFTRPRT